jgi:hypothetical protein
MSATSGLDSAKATNILNAITGRAAITAWSGTTGKLKLITPTGTTNETGDGTEVSGGSYPAGGITYTVTGTFGSAGYSTGVTSITNSGSAITQTGMPATTVANIALYDNGAVRWWWAAVTTSVTTNSGDTLTFATSSITLQVNM